MRSHACEDGISPLDVLDGLLGRCQSQSVLLWMLKEGFEGTAMLAITPCMMLHTMPRWMLQGFPKLKAVTHAPGQELDHGR